MPGQLIMEEFYRSNKAKTWWDFFFGKEEAKSKVTILREDENDSKDLVPANFYVIGVENLIDYDFISGLFYNRSKDDSLF